MEKTQIKLQLKDYGYKVFSLCFWLIIWEVIARIVDNDIIMVSPVSVLLTLLRLIGTYEFWKTIIFSAAKIISGFLLALFLGILLAVGSYWNRLIQEMFAPLMKVIKSIPVVSFVLLALIWMKSKNLSILCSFMMVLPMIYSNVLQGLKSTDVKLLQMAKVFRVSPLKKIKGIYVPSVIPYFISAVSVGMGYSWKAGIAAEVIGFPSGTIGLRLYESKLYLMIDEMFAWTIVIIMISVLLEKVVMILFRQ